MGDLSFITKNIQLIRNNKKITQARLCNDIGMDCKHYSKIENGLHQPRLETIVKIAKFLCISPVELFYHKNMTNPYLTTFNNAIEELNVYEYNLIVENIKVLSKHLKLIENKSDYKDNKELKFIGRNIKRARYYNNMSQSQLSYKVKISVGYLSHIENDIKTPKLDTFINIVDVLGITPYELLLDTFDLYGDLLYKTFELDELMNLTPVDYKFIYEHLIILIKQLKELQEPSRCE